MLRMIVALIIFSTTASSVVAGEMVTLAGTPSAPTSSTDSLEHRCCVRFDLPAHWRGKRVEYAAVELQFVTPADSCRQYMLMLYPIRSEIRPRPGRATVSESYTDSLGVPVLVLAENGYKARVLLTTLLQRWADGEIECAGFVVVCRQPGADKAALVEPEGENPPQMEVRLGSQ